MRRAEKAARIHEILERLYPDPPVPLDHRDPFTLLVAVLLSAQTTDALADDWWWYAIYLALAVGGMIAQFIDVDRRRDTLPSLRRNSSSASRRVRSRSDSWLRSMGAVAGAPASTVGGSGVGLKAFESNLLAS